MKKMDGKPDGSGNGRIHGSVRQSVRGAAQRNAGSSAPAGTTAAEAGASGETQAADAGEPVDGGVLTISLSSSPKNLDPVKYTGTYESQIIGSVCDTLVEYNSSLTEIMPSIAASWEVSDDGKRVYLQAEG